MDEFWLNPYSDKINYLNFKKLDDTLKNAIDNFVAEQRERRKSIIDARLKERSIFIDWELEGLRRFKSLSVSFDDNGHEVVYYNDGSLNGLRVVTFVYNEQLFNPKTNSFHFTTSYF